MTGQDVRCPDGRVAGRLADLTVWLDEHAGPQLVERLLVQRHRAPDAHLHEGSKVLAMMTETP